MMFKISIESLHEVDGQPFWHHDYGLEESVDTLTTYASEFHSAYEDMAEAKNTLYEVLTALRCRPSQDPGSFIMATIRDEVDKVVSVERWERIPPKTVSVGNREFFITQMGIDTDHQQLYWEVQTSFPLRGWDFLRFLERIGLSSDLDDESLDCVGLFTFSVKVSCEDDLIFIKLTYPQMLDLENVASLY